MARRRCAWVRMGINASPTGAMINGLKRQSVPSQQQVKWSTWSTSSWPLNGCQMLLLINLLTSQGKPSMVINLWITCWWLINDAWWCLILVGLDENQIRRTARLPPVSPRQALTQLPAPTKAGEVGRWPAEASQKNESSHELQSFFGP